MFKSKNNSDCSESIEIMISIIDPEIKTDEDVDCIDFLNDFDSHV
jgi:hypothetical protein